MAVDVQNTLRGPIIRLQTGDDETTTVVGGAFGIVRTAAQFEGILLRVRLSVVNAGTPTLDVDAEDSWDGTNWNTWISAAQLSGVGENQTVATRLPGPFIRSNAVIGGGTPDIDFEVDILGVGIE